MLLKGHRRYVFLILLSIVALLAFVNLPRKRHINFTTRINYLVEDFLGWDNGSKNWGDLQDQITAASPDRKVSNVDPARREVFSPSTTDGAYFFIKFGDQGAINPNIIPHPSLKNTWIIVAQQHKSPAKHTAWFAELVCSAVFENDTLACVEPPMLLPIAATSGANCEGEMDYFNLNVGPHDARVFYGPRTPYVLYGSNSIFTCFGQWMQDLRVLVDWGFGTIVEERFKLGIELQRPPPYRPVEKNWFVFWDKYEQLYVHYDIAPTRSFAKLEYDGSTGQDLAPFAALNDYQCLGKYMPTVALELESLHQATNSLSITLCKRSDLLCKPDDSNTFIFTMFQHKSFYAFHSVYEPYIVLFQQEAPFGIHAISQKSIWINGRRKLGTERSPSSAQESQTVEDHSEMFYVTSMNWKKQGQKYHGYLDDVLFIAFGIEDKKTAAIDVVAGDLFQDLAFCSYQ
ncbi:hypothetical protein MMC10_005307 [Thelotrema lepadinum]|nr:hypothetical protein [Thelotrema lepadinum]